MPTKPTHTPLVSDPIYTHDSRGRRMVNWPATANKYEERCKELESDVAKLHDTVNSLRDDNSKLRSHCETKERELKETADKFLTHRNLLARITQHWTAFWLPAKLKLELRDRGIVR